MTGYEQSVQYVAGVRACWLLRASRAIQLVELASQ